MLQADLGALSVDQMLAPPSPDFRPGPRARAVFCWLEKRERRKLVVCWHYNIIGFIFNDQVAASVVGYRGDKDFAETMRAGWLQCEMRSFWSRVLA